MKKAVICLIKTQLQVEEIITRLRAAGVPTIDISLVLLERSGLLGLVRDRDAHINGSKAREVQSGGAIGGVLGMLSDIGLMTIPGAGTHITAGPLATHLAGDAVQAGGGGVANGLVAMGFPMPRARHYEQQIRVGDILLGFHSALAAQIHDAQATLHKLRAQDVLVSDESACTDAHA